jgi:ERCC4-type nuclease
MRPVASAAGVSPDTKSAPAPAPEPDHYLMDLGDGITMKVPLPKKTPTNTAVNTAASCKDKSLDTAAATAATIHEIKSERLPLGDIIIHDPAQGRDIVLFERKSLNDLAASIQDGRYKEQSFRLTQTTDFHNHNIIYIIEGDIARYNAKHSRISKSALQSAMVSLLYYKGFSVIRTMSVGETAEFILHFADKVAKERTLGPAVPAYSNTLPCDDDSSAERYSEVASKKEKRDYITRENIGEIMLAQVPGVSPKIATGIMKKYGGSVYEFLADLRRKLNNYEESVSPQMSSPLPVMDLELVSIKETPTKETPTKETPTKETPTKETPTKETDARPSSPMNKNKLKHVSECFRDIGDGKRNIGKVTIEKLCYFLS